MCSVPGRNRRSRHNLSIRRTGISVDSELRPQTDRGRMPDAGMAVDFVGYWVHRPELPGSVSIVLAAKIDNLVFERFLAVPTIAGGDTAISGNLLALVDTEKRYIIWAIAKLSCAVHSTHSDPAG